MMEENYIIILRRRGGGALLQQPKKNHITRAINSTHISLCRHIMLLLLHHLLASVGVGGKRIEFFVITTLCLCPLFLIILLLLYIVSIPRLQSIIIYIQ